MGMYQGTTPTIPLRFEGINLAEAKVYVSLYDEKKKQLHVYESGRDFMVSQSGYDSITSLALTQEETLGLGVGLCTIQGRWVFPDGSAGATKKVSIQVQSVLQKDVISYDS